MLEIFARKTGFPSDVVGGFAGFGIDAWRASADTQLTADAIEVVRRHIVTCALFYIAKEARHGKGRHDVQHAIIDHPACDKTTALCVLWANHPLQFLDAEPFAGTEKSFAIVREINDRIARDQYPVVLSSYRRITETMYLHNGRWLPWHLFRHELVCAMTGMQHLRPGEDGRWLAEAVERAPRTSRLKDACAICAHDREDLRLTGSVWSLDERADPFVDGHIDPYMFDGLRWQGTDPIWPAVDYADIAGLIRKAS